MRKLKANEIECRIGQVKKDSSGNPKGLTLLLYKDARCDMDILDETFGPLGWKRTHSRDNANCVVSVWDKVNQHWVEKEDVGTASNTEAEKGLASDSFKRACVNWGIGRELYSAPFIWVPAEKVKFVQVNGKYTTLDKFKVLKIDYNDEGEISGLIIANAKTNEHVYTFRIIS